MLSTASGEVVKVLDVNSKLQKKLDQFALSQTKYITVRNLPAPTGNVLLNSQKFDEQC